MIHEFSSDGIEYMIEILRDGYGLYVDILSRKNNKYRYSYIGSQCIQCQTIAWMQNMMKKVPKEARAICDRYVKLMAFS